MPSLAGVDGYRAAFTLSELVNRNDQEETLVIDRKDEQGSGRFSLFPAADFFSDRAIKSVMEINLLLPVGGSKWAIVVHGGAGVITRDRMTPETEAEYRAMINGGRQIPAPPSLPAVALPSMPLSALRIMEDSAYVQCRQGRGVHPRRH
ncbi:MAG: hypothetical protein MZV63_45405 [Marinilabiliales bacterium]|nr:hypothetical protein [Marinilabiliales bacterium]